MRRAQRHPWWQRVIAVCLAVWFVAVATGLPELHACALHDGMGMGGQSAGSPAHAGHTAMGGTGASHQGGAHAGASSDAAPHGRSGDPGQHACTCLGHCCGAASVAPPTVALRPVLSRTVVPSQTPGRPEHEYVAAWVDFVLPFSTAPPSRATV